MLRSFALGEHFEAFIEAQVESGRFNDASEVVRVALRLLEDQEGLRQLRAEDIRHSIEAARMRGKTKPADLIFSQLAKKLGRTKQGLA